MPEHHFCRVPWFSLDIGADGHAHPCCRSYDINLGKVTSENNPWMHPTLMELRHQLATNTLDPDRFVDCQKCPMRYEVWTSTNVGDSE